MALNDKKIGILIPTLNRCAFLKDALKSAQEQTWENIEIIVIDNGSTDDTPEYMASIHDPRVTYIVNESNLGLTGSINKGINLFSDSVVWCLILSDDDILHPDFISSMLIFLKERWNLLVAYGHITFLDRNLNKLRKAVTSPMFESSFAYLTGRIYAQRETFLSSVIFHKQSFIAIGGYPVFSTGFATDDALIFHLGSKGGGIGFNKDARCYVRLHSAAESFALTDNLKKYITTFFEFRDYCVEVAESYTLNAEELLKIINRRIKRWISPFMIKSDRYKEYLYFSREKKDSIVELIKQIYYFLPARIKFDYIIFLRFGIALEKFKIYRYMCNVLTSASYIFHPASWAVIISIIEGKCGVLARNIFLSKIKSIVL